MLTLNLVREFFIEIYRNIITYKHVLFICFYYMYIGDVKQKIKKNQVGNSIGNHQGNKVGNDYKKESFDLDSLK